MRPNEKPIANFEESVCSMFAVKWYLNSNTFMSLQNKPDRLC